MALPLEVVLVGAGSRGQEVFGHYALEKPERMRVVAVAEPHPERREVFARQHGLSPEQTFDDWRALLAGDRRAPAAIIATGDDVHFRPVMTALRAGYHCLLEKPMAMRYEECVAIVEEAEKQERILQLGHVLRYTEFYSTVHRVVAQERRLGEIQTISMAEHVAHWHFTHSFVRGKWRSSDTAAPLILAKTCHDLDLMCWFVGQDPLRVTSVGDLNHYNPLCAPEGATERCLEGCAVEPACPHSAPRFYGVDAPFWPWNDVSPEPSVEARLDALVEGPYGRCVYDAGNDLVDRQSVILVFEGGLLGTFLVDGFASRPERTVRIQGTRAELRGVFEKGEIEILRYGELEPERIQTFASAIGHGGGDYGLLDHFTDVASREAVDEVLASGRAGLESHRIGFAAERSRMEGRTVSLDEFP